jgi:hypothetical protein
MKQCVDEGTLQSYFDGELSIDMMEKVCSHLSSCLACKRAARELESESLLLSEALEPEFTLSVPTERLRARIDTAVAEQRLLHPNLVNRPAAPLASRWFRSLAELFAFSPQRAFGYAGLAALVLFAITFALVRFRTAPAPNPQQVAVKSPESKADPSTGPVATASPEQPAAVVINQPGPQRRKRALPVSPKHNDNGGTLATNNEPPFKLLPGERGYLKTIAALDTSLKSSANKPMRPGLQSEYERNLAMVDRAIAATRNAAKSNPNDPDAAEFMFAAYQTKVDLLNQVADARLPNRQQK